MSPSFREDPDHATGYRRPRVWPYSVFRLPSLLTDQSIASAKSAAFEELPVAGLTGILAVVDHHSPARQHSLCHTFYLHSFIGAVIDVHVMSCCRNGHLFVRVEDYNVGIRTD